VAFLTLKRIDTLKRRMWGYKTLLKFVAE